MKRVAGVIALASVLMLAPSLALADAPVKREEKPIWPVAVMGGSAAVGLVLAIAGFVVAVQHSAEARDIATTLRDAGETCADRPELCRVGDDALATRQTFEGVGIAGLVVCVASVTGMAIYRLVPAPARKAKKAALQISLQVAGARLEVAFQ